MQLTRINIYISISMPGQIISVSVLSVLDFVVFSFVIHFASPFQRFSERCGLSHCASVFIIAITLPHIGGGNGGGATIIISIFGYATRMINDNWAFLFQTEALIWAFFHQFFAHHTLFFSHPNLIPILPSPFANKKTIASFRTECVYV